MTKRHSATRLSCEQLEDRVVPASAANEAYVRELYLELLNRPADSASVQVLANQLDAGLSKAQVALNVMAGVEFRATLVNEFYESFLDRSADTIGLVTWSARLQHESVEQVQAAILGSAEFFQKTGGTNDAFLAALYEKVLVHPIDPNSAAIFGQLLRGGTSREGVALLILGSDEYREAFVNSLYQDFLNRDAEQAGVDHWVDQLKQGNSDQGVIAGVISSPEFQSRNLRAPATPKITSPTTARTVLATTFTITGTAEAGSLVQVRAKGVVVRAQQLADNDTTFSITVPLTVNAANNFKVSARNAAGLQSAAATVPTITQSNTPVNIVTPAQQTTREGVAVSLPVVATDATGKTLTYSATGLPAGLSINTTTGVIAGTIGTGASASSPYTVTVRATNGTQQDSATFTWVVNPPAPTITVPATQLHANGSVISGVTVTATGSGTNPITFSATGLPPGLTINSTTGVISGTIAATASNNSPYAVKVSATQNSQTGTKSFTWVVPTSATSTLPFSLTDPAWVTLSSGVRILDQTVGTGTATARNKTINVDYIGYLTDGTIFDDGEGFSSQLNAGSLIQGWVDAIPGMKVGGVRLLDIPSSLAYGANPPQGSSIPPNAELIFKVTLNSTT